MKTLTFTFLSILILSSCVDPMRLIQKGNDYQALEMSLKKLNRKRIKDDHLLAFQLAFDMVSQKDAAIIQDLRDEGIPRNWLTILDRAEAIQGRQIRVKKTLAHLSNKGFFPEVNFYPVEALLEEANNNVALYYYAQALEYIPASRNEDRRSARRAYYFLEKCRTYRSNFKDAIELENEMFAIGTTHILLNPSIEPNDPELSDEFFQIFFGSTPFPMNVKNWTQLHLETPENETMDFRVDMYFENVWVSQNNFSQSTCNNSEEVQTGCKQVEEWNEQDSAYVTVTVPVYETVYVTVNKFEQSKSAKLTMSGNLLDLKTGEIVEPFSFKQTSSWCNNFSTFQGDSDAFSILCKDIGGFETSYPTGESLLKNCVPRIRRKFERWKSLVDE